MDNNLLVIRKTECRSGHSPCGRGYRKKGRLHSGKRLHGDMDIWQHAFPGNAEGFRDSPCGVERLSPVAAFLPDSKAREDGYRMESRHQRTPPIEDNSQGTQRV